MKPPDANDILRRNGPESLREVIDGAATMNGIGLGEAQLWGDENGRPRFKLIQFKPYY